jgi:hypothetical protein
VYNIQKAVSRLDYAPKTKEIEITDIKKGLGVFVPKPERRVSFAALKAALKQAGYTLDRADITISGTLKREGSGWTIVASPSGQSFALEGAGVEKILVGVAVDSRVELIGDWQTKGKGTAAREVVVPREIKKTASASNSETDRAEEDASVGKPVGGTVVRNDAAVVRFERAGFVGALERDASVGGLKNGMAALAPIRTTSPGLTVYKGGAITPRLYFVKQHLGELDVIRQTLNMSASYTPTPRLQLEAEVPFSRTSFDDGGRRGSALGLGNITLWSKYRFFRTVKTYGDSQAAARLGLELPTGSRSAPDEREVNAPAFVRQQLTPINGGLSPHFDLAYSRAGGRFIFGGNVEGILRGERAGFRMGHELRVNTDFEYVLLPREYRSPGRELFVIFETNFVWRGRGRIDGNAVEASKATEVYFAPGLQYAAAPRFVVEGSVQIPVLRNAGALALRTDANVLLGVRYLF